jgi:hypothetical protein
MNNLNLGETEVFEVWFMPTNRENYATYVVQTYLSLVSAQARIEEMRSVVYGTYEIVRARTVRQLMARAST